MSSPAVAPPEPGPNTPVFVDDSGRRRARLRIVVRVVVGLLGLYVALAAISLVAPLSLPVAHLGKLGVLPRHRQNATLGPLSKEAPLPAALAGSGTPPGGPSSRTPSGANVSTATTIATSPSSTPTGTTPGGVIIPPGRSTTPSAATTIPAAPTTAVSTAPAADTTTPATGQPSTTTVPRGPSTTGSHGPPSTTPAKGSKP